MTRFRTAGLAWVLCGLAIALGSYSLSQDLRATGAAASALAIANRVLNASFTVAFGVVGALIISRQPRNTTGWLLMVIALPFAIRDPSLSGAAVPTWQDVVLAWYGNWSWWLLMAPLLLILMLFPTGRLLSPRWKWVVVSLTVCCLLFVTLTAFSQNIDRPDGSGRLTNPIGFLSDDVAGAVLLPWELVLLANVALAVSAIFIRYRRAAPVERQQIKWLLLACALFLAAFIGSAVFDFTETGLSSLVFDFAILAIPIAIGIAIVRYRLWDIDVLIRRTLVYAVLSGLLALAYFGSVLVLQSAFSAVTGQQQSALVTVLSTLVIAALFVPLRTRVQAVIDRRLYRRKYDAARTLAAFGANVRDEVEMSALTEQLLRVVDDTMQPAQVGLWLKTDTN